MTSPKPAFPAPAPAPAAGLEARKAPVQSRGKERMRRILEAAHRLLRAGGPAALTTPAIAREAGIAVGSLYQYFPNKEAVVLALYQSRLEQVRGFVSDPIAAPDGDWRTGMRNWVIELKRREAEADYDLAMNEAMDHFPGLKAISRQHAAMQAGIIAGQLRALGSDWPDDALFDLAAGIFFTSSSTWLYWSFAGAPLAQGIERLADCVVTLAEPALDGRSPPPPPYVSAEP